MYFIHFYPPGKKYKVYHLNYRLTYSVWTSYTQHLEKLLRHGSPCYEKCVVHSLCADVNARRSLELYSYSVSSPYNGVHIV